MEETVARKRAELAARDAKLLVLNQVFLKSKGRNIY
jgi:hypothetical protein